MKKIDNLINQVKALFALDHVHFDTPEYVKFHNDIFKFIYSNHCENTEEWKIIEKNLVYKSSQFMSRSEANIILFQLNKLKGHILARENEPLFQYIHPQIARVSKKLFTEGNYDNASENAFKEIASRVRKLFVKLNPRQQPPTNDNPLMTTVFSDNNPMIEFCDRTEISGKNVQLGYMLMLAGAMSALRNPNAHVNDNKITKDDCSRQLVFASMLMYKIDEAVKHSGVLE